MKFDDADLCLRKAWLPQFVSSLMPKVQLNQKLQRQKEQNDNASLTMHQKSPPISNRILSSIEIVVYRESLRGQPAQCMHWKTSFTSAYPQDRLIFLLQIILCSNTLSLVSPCKPFLQSSVPGHYHAMQPICPLYVNSSISTICILSRYHKQLTIGLACLR